MGSGRRNALAALSIALLVSLVSACFITNCPPGGKRSGGRGAGPAAQCMACGADRRGRCVGPDICCSPENGCQIRTKDSLVCRFEILSPRLCKVPGPSCGPNGSGVCASDGICCTNDSCTVDKSCLIGRDISISDLAPRFEQPFPQEQF